MRIKSQMIEIIYVSLCASLCFGPAVGGVVAKIFSH